MAVSEVPRQGDVERAIVQIAEGDASLTLDYAGARARHQGNSWWGVAVGFRAMQAAAGLLSQTTKSKLFIPGVRRRGCSISSLA